MDWTRELLAMFKLSGREAQQMDEAQVSALIDMAFDQAGSEDCD